MRTSKPISTISYNSEKFLQEKIFEFIENGYIDFGCYIYHLPEEDENEKKPHYHVLMFPSCRIDTNVLKKEFEEYDENHDKPLGVTVFMNSKFGDWFLYGLHDVAYLMSKNQKRKHHYLIADFWSSDEDFFRDRVAHVDRSKFAPQERIRNCIEQGLSFEEMVNLGVVPVQLINQYEKVYNILSNTYRNGRETHTPKKPHNYGGEFMVNEDGEIITNGWGKSAGKEDFAQSPARSPVVEQIPFD